jgi:putative ABC transport system permease protein
MLAWGFAAAIMAALLASVIPALRAARLDPNTVLKGAGPKTSAGRGERRLLSAVTMAQSALTLALLVGSGLLIRTMINVAHVRAGYRTDRILKATVTATQGDWKAFHQQALERVSALPGVEGAAFAWGVPLTGNDWPGEVEIEGMPPAAKASDRIQLPLRAVTPGYFAIFGQAITAGRDFRPTDVQKAPGVAIVNQALVDRYLPHTNPLGKKLWPWGGRQNSAIEIVGVVAKSRTGDLTKPAEPEVYFSLWQAQAFSKDLVVRTSADPKLVMAAVERALRSVDPTAAVENVKTMQQIREDSLASRSFAERLLIGFAVVGSVLTLVGIYGVLSLSVASRRRELAIRSAVGAQQRDIRNLIFGEGFRLIAGGVVAGMAAGLVLSRVLKSFLFEVKPTDPVTLIGVAVLFAGVSLLACWAPTRRAAKVDPVEALRYE